LRFWGSKIEILTKVAHRDVLGVDLDLEKGNFRRVVRASEFLKRDWGGYGLVSQRFANGGQFRVSGLRVCCSEMLGKKRENEGKVGIRGEREGDGIGGDAG
jgi:hypothetical protein